MSARPPFQQPDGEQPPDVPTEVGTVNTESTMSAPGRTGLFDLLTLLARHKRLIWSVTLAFAGIAGMGAVLTPSRFTAEATILPPSQDESVAAALMKELQTFAGSPEITLGAISPTDLCIAILRRRAIQNAIVDQYDLRSVYHAKRYDDARRQLDANTEILAEKEGQISISVSDRDPRRAAGLANAYVEQLRSLDRVLAQSKAKQWRSFYESELADEREVLSKAESSLTGAEERTGLVQPASQAQTIVASIASTRTQIGAAEAKLQAMRLYATPGNPDLQRAEVEVAGLRGHLAELERGNRGLGDGNVAIPARQLPQVELEYRRDARDLKYHEALYQFLSRQAEAARLDETKPAAMIAVIDEATVPEKPSGPPRFTIVLIGAAVGFLLTCLWVMVAESVRWRKLHADQLQAAD